VTEGEEMFELAERLWPIGRSLSGEGVRETLRVIRERLPGLEIQELHSGERFSDWTIPLEWNVKAASLVDEDGNVVCDYAENNLHLVGYSVPVSGQFTLDELKSHLFSLPHQPTAIPYVTSYYSPNWGFCLSHNVRKKLRPGKYTVSIDTTLEPGCLNFGELVVQGRSKREVLFSTYICHPSMANNELSGPVLATALASFVSRLDGHYTYRFLFLPETIGAISYIAKNLPKLKQNLQAGFVLSCVGDDRAYSYVPSRSGNTVADKAALKVLRREKIEFKAFSWKDRGSDERQYCAPGVDLPVCSVMRSKYGEYPEYHTSLDQLGTVVSAIGLQGSFDFYVALIAELEMSRYPRITTLGEPQLGPRGLYPNTSTKPIKGAYSDFRAMVDVISFLDGTLTMEEVAEESRTTMEFVAQVCEILSREGLIAY
jgi:aminopeptidase-like protein